MTPMPQKRLRDITEDLSTEVCEHPRSLRTRLSIDTRYRECAEGTS